MSREETAKELRHFDIRTIERSIRRGLVTRKDYDKYLKSLPDVADKAAPMDDDPAEAAAETGDAPAAPTP